MNNDFTALLDKISSANFIGIITHKIPDADAVGSSCGLAYTLRELGKKVEVIFEKELKDEYNFFNLQDIATTTPSDSYDLIIATDSGDTSRFGILEPLFLAQENTINIDHHITNPKYAKLNYVDATRSSACEYLVHILNTLQVKIPLKAQSLFYVGIIRDCGAFMYSNTSSTTHRIVAQLIDNGIDYVAINEHFMQTTSYKTIILEKYALNSIELYDDGKILFMNLPYSVFEKENCTIEDTSQIVSKGISVEGVKLAIMSSETQPNVHKVSFRSREPIDASAVAIQFGGGGHARAAGCQLKGSYIKVHSQLLKQAQLEMKNVEGKL